MQINPEISDLVRQVYLGVLEDTPWESFFTELRERLGAHTVTLLLRPPGNERQVAMLASGGNLSEIESYNRGQFVLDPFINLPAGKVVSLHEFVTTEALLASEFYKVVMEPQGWYDFLGADLRDEHSLEVRFRIGRYKGSRRFADKDRELIETLLPHLAGAIQIYRRLHQSEKERALYAGAIGELSVGTIILDESGVILSMNALAQELLSDKNGLFVRSERLHLSTRTETGLLAELLEGVLQAQQTGEPVAVEALRVRREHNQPDLGLVIKAIPGLAKTAGGAVPSAAIFVSDPARTAEAPVQVVARLFDLTPTEAALAMLLTNGLSLDEASGELGVSLNTSRTHLRSVFNKTGVNRQASLVRLILKSVASLA